VDTYQIVIGADVVLYQILDEILMEGPSPSLDKPELETSCDKSKL
jgi:hypothetical protein